MTVNELIELLTDLADEGRGNNQVRMATQPKWPLAHHVADVVCGWDIDADEVADHHLDIVWIVEGAQDENPYAPKEVFGAD